MTRDAGEERLSPLYPAISPYASGLLDVGDGHRLYWEACGDPSGVPAAFLHGGPGGGCNRDHRRLFDPARFNALLFDQRGCGRSQPHASLICNTTEHLVEDLERLRQFREIDRWILVGGSWGSALALAYAERYPERVSALVLRGVFTVRASELRWLYEEGASCLFPEAWNIFASYGGPRQSDDLIARYRRLLDDPNPEARREAARVWCAWEAATMTLRPRSGQPQASFEDDALLALAQIETHYFSNRAFLKEGQLLAQAHRLAGIPGVIVQGRYDCVTPAATAWELHQIWPESRLLIAPEAGHASSEPGVMEAMIAALDRFAAAPELLL